MVDFQNKCLRHLPAAVSSHVEHDLRGSIATLTTIHALRSEMMQTARQQAQEMFGFVTQIATESGWKVEYVAKTVVGHL